VAGGIVIDFKVQQGAGIILFLVLTACSTPPENAPFPPDESVAMSYGAPPPAAASQPPGAALPMITVVPGSLGDFQRNVGDRIYFDYDRAELSSAARDILRRQAAWLLRYPSVTLVVEGHCDERGTREYNLALGARRASAVMDYLMTMGVNAARLETVSYGKERPSCIGSAEVCWQENRRGISTIKGGAVMAGT
jgi:peptidoglycan-associated lipoprotein